jgi:hypothetical protein
MKYFISILASLMFVGCNRVDNPGEGITQEIITGTYEGKGAVRQEVYRKELLPIKVQAFYDDGSVMGQTNFIPMDSLMLISTRTYYPSGMLKSLNLRESRIDTFANTSVDGKVTKSIRFLRDYYIYLLELYPDGKIQRRFGLNNLDSARVIETWDESGIKRSEEVDKFYHHVPLKSLAWDSLGHPVSELKR